MQISFQSSTELKSVTASIHAYIFGNWIPWRLGTKSNVCNHLENGAKCPIKANEKATYVLLMDIPRVAPVGTKTVVQLRLVDNQKAAIACTRFPVLVSA